MLLRQKSNGKLLRAHFSSWASESPISRSLRGNERFRRQTKTFVALRVQKTMLWRQKSNGKPLRAHFSSWASESPILRSLRGNERFRRQTKTFVALQRTLRVQKTMLLRRKSNGKLLRAHFSSWASESPISRSAVLVFSWLLTFFLGCSRFFLAVGLPAALADALDERAIDSRQRTLSVRLDDLLFGHSPNALVTIFTRVT